MNQYDRADYPIVMYVKLIPGKEDNILINPKYFNDLDGINLTGVQETFFEKVEELRNNIFIQNNYLDVLDEILPKESENIDWQSNKYVEFINLSIISKDRKLFDFFLGQFHVDLNQNPYDKNPLFHAIMVQDEYFVDKLIKSGSNVNFNGLNLLILAMELENLNIVESLLNAHSEYDTHDLLLNIFGGNESPPDRVGKRIFARLDSHNKKLYIKFRELLMNSTNINLSVNDGSENLSLADFAVRNDISLITLIFKFPIIIDEQKLIKAKIYRFKRILSHAIGILKREGFIQNWWFRSLQEIKEFIDQNQEFKFEGYEKLDKINFISDEYIKILESINFDIFINRNGGIS